jgi:hypothetical protein
MPSHVSPLTPTLLALYGKHVDTAVSLVNRLIWFARFVVNALLIMHVSIVTPLLYRYLMLSYTISSS